MKDRHFPRHTQKGEGEGEGQTLTATHIAEHHVRVRANNRCPLGRSRLSPLPRLPPIPLTPLMPSIPRTPPTPSIPPLAVTFPFEAFH